MIGKSLIQSVGIKLLVLCQLIFIFGCALHKNSLKTEEIQLVFVSSDECGYCLDMVPYSIGLHEKYKTKVEFISYYENDSTELLWQLKSFGIKNSLDIPWKKFYGADSLIKVLPIDNGRPQTIIYFKNKIYGIHNGSSEETLMKIGNELKTLCN